MEENTYDQLVRIRAKTQELVRLRESMARLGAMYKSPNMDGMPKGAGSGDAMDRRLCALEEMRSRAEKLEKEIQEIDGAARGAMQELPQQLHTFCTVYFLAACSVNETCRIMEKAKNTVIGYRIEVRDFFNAKLNQIEPKK